MPGVRYAQNFPDPHVLLHEGTYYAYGTGTGGSMMPVMTSTDLVSWTARPHHDSDVVTSTCPNGVDPSADDDPFLNDALVCPPKWGLALSGHPHMIRRILAPSVLEVSPGQWRAYYAVMTRWGNPFGPGGNDTFCISVASATSPLGPFFDNSSGPLRCDGSQVGGVLDPYAFLDDPDGDGIGTPHLIWKTEGVPSGLPAAPSPQPTRFYSQQLAADGLSFAPGSSRAFLLETGQPWNPNTWEGTVIENPTLVSYKGKLILGWSANRWQGANYRFGMGICQTVRGPCSRGAGGVPVLANRGTESSRAGGNLFVDATGHLRVSYHYWTPPYTDYPSFPACQANGTCTTQGQRRMAVVAHSGFLDVNPGSPFEAEIGWLVDGGHAEGYADASFRPQGSITRQAFAAMLARYEGDAAGSGACDGAAPFVDVSSAHVFCPEIGWLASRSITSGYRDGTFGPTLPITRQALAAFLYRYAHGGADAGRCTGPSPFVDVAADSPFCAAIVWLADTQITTGYDGNVFGPVAPVTRQAFAAFLARFDALDR